jgi:hypothetical protein
MHATWTSLHDLDGYLQRQRFFPVLPFNEPRAILLKTKRLPEFLFAGTARCQRAQTSRHSSTAYQPDSPNQPGIPPATRLGFSRQRSLSGVSALAPKKSRSAAKNSPAPTAWKMRSLRTLRSPLGHYGTTAWSRSPPATGAICKNDSPKPKENAWRLRRPAKSRSHHEVGSNCSPIERHRLNWRVYSIRPNSGPDRHHGRAKLRNLTRRRDAPCPQQLGRQQRLHAPRSHTCVYLFRTTAAGARNETPEAYYCRSSPRQPRASVAAVLKYIATPGKN